VTDTAPVAVELLGLEAWDRLEPAESQRIELVDGALIVTPRPQFSHSLASGRLHRLLDAQAGAGHVVLIESEVVIDPDFPATVRIPDLMVIHRSAMMPGAYRATPEDVVLAVELVSPGSVHTDYGAKRYEYEQAQIPYYWIVDIAQRRIICLKLVDEEYREVAIATAPSGDRVIPEPIRIEFGWDELIS
jgi:Uma2 family endonuclease